MSLAEDLRVSTTTPDAAPVTEAEKLRLATGGAKLDYAPVEKAASHAAVGEEPDELGKLIHGLEAPVDPRRTDTIEALKVGGYQLANQALFGIPQIVADHVLTPEQLQEYQDMRERHSDANALGGTAGFVGSLFVGGPLFKVAAKAGELGHAAILGTQAAENVGRAIDVSHAAAEAAHPAAVAANEVGHGLRATQAAEQALPKAMAALGPEAATAMKAVQETVTEHLADALGNAASKVKDADQLASLVAQAAKSADIAKVAAGAAKVAAPGLAREVMAKAVQYGIEGAVLSAPSTVTNAAFGDWKHAGESLALGAGLGMALGGGLDFVSSAVKKGGAKLLESSTAEKIFEKVDHAELELLGGKPKDLSGAKAESLKKFLNDHVLTGADSPSTLSGIEHKIKGIAENGEGHAKEHAEEALEIIEHNRAHAEAHAEEHVGMFGGHGHEGPSLSNMFGLAAAGHHVAHATGIAALGAPVMGALAVGAVARYATKVAVNQIKDRGLVAGVKLLRQLAPDAAEGQFGLRAAQQFKQVMDAKLQEVGPAVRRMAQSGAQRVTKPAVDQVKKTLGSSANGLPKDKQFKALSDKLSNVSPDHAEGLASTVSPVAPNVAQAYHSTMVNQAAWMQSQVPRPPAPQPFQNHEGWKPTPTQLRQFNDKLEVMNDPHAAVEHMEKGTLTADHVAAVANLWPSYYEKAKQEVLTQAYAPQAPPLGFQARNQVSLFLGSPIDPSVTSIGLLSAPQVPSENASEASNSNPPRHNSSSSGPARANTMDDQPSLQTQSQQVNEGEASSS